jgi:hypothetical protein
MAPDGANQPEKNRGFSRRDPQWQHGYARRVSHDLNDVFWERHRKHWASLEAPSADALHHYAPVAAFVGAFLGCLTTLHLSASGIVPGIASALATTALCGQLLLTRTTSLFPGEIFPAFYGGTFAGMTPVFWLMSDASSRSVAPVEALSISLSIVCGLAFFIVTKIDARSGAPLASGCGGRSGAIATVASFLFVELARLFGADDGAFRSRPEMLDVDPRSAMLACSACMVGIFATLFVLRQRRVASAKPADRTFVASATALIGLIALNLNSSNGAGTLDSFYAGCFLGMSSPERLKGWIQPILGAVVLSAILFQVKIFLPGVGGGLGFAAFVTVAVLVGLSRMTTLMTREMVTPDQRLAAATQAPPSGHVYPDSVNHPKPLNGQTDVKFRQGVLTSRSQIRLLGRGTRVSPSFEPRGSSTLRVLDRSAIVVANLVPAILAIGCFVVFAVVRFNQPPRETVSDQSVPVATVSSALDDAKPTAPTPENLSKVTDPRGYDVPLWSPCTVSGGPNGRDVRCKEYSTQAMSDGEENSTKLYTRWLPLWAH